MRDLAPAPKRGNMRKVYDLIGPNTVALRSITKGVKLEKKVTAQALQNLMWKGYVMKAGAYYCLNTREGYDARQAEIAKANNDKKAAAVIEPVMNAQQEGALNAARKAQEDGMRRASLGESWTMEKNQIGDPFKFAGLGTAAKKPNPLVTADRVYMAALTIIVALHLLIDGGFL